ncbi:hypothetical protein ACLK19_00380 [Escherichia coli]
MFGFTARRASDETARQTVFRRYGTRASINARADFSNLRFTQLKDSVNILLHGVNQFAAGVRLTALAGG